MMMTSVMSLGIKRGLSKDKFLLFLSIYLHLNTVAQFEKNYVNRVKVFG